MAELNFEKMPKWFPEALTIITMIDTWAEAYKVPREEILRQIPLAYSWACSNPKMAPKKQVMRFLNNWMANAKRWGNLVARRVDHKRAADVEGDMTFEEMQAIRKANLGNLRGEK